MAKNKGYGFVYVPCTINEIVTKEISNKTDIDFSNININHRYLVKNPVEDFIKKDGARNNSICVVDDRGGLRFYSPTRNMCLLNIDRDEILQFKENNEWVSIYTFLVSEHSGGGGGGGGTGITDAPNNNKLYGRKNRSWVQVPEQAISSDAPNDINIYGRKGGNWVKINEFTDVTDPSKKYLRKKDGWVEYQEPTIPSPIITSDVPNDNKNYVRKNKNWSVLTIPEQTISTDVPVDGKQYVRKDKTWSEIQFPTQAISTDAPSDTKVYGRKDNNWEEITLTTGIVDVAIDGKQYVRKDKAWSELSLPISSDVPNDNKLYARKYGAWNEIEIPTVAITDDAPSDGFEYVRSNANWKKLIIPSSPSGGITDVTDNKKYLRSLGAWAEYTEPAIMDDAASDSKIYGRKDGTWAEIQTSTITDPPLDGFVYGRMGHDWTRFSADLIPGADTEELFGFGRDGGLITLDQHFESFVSKINTNNNPNYTKEKEYILKENKWEEITGYNKYIDLNCYVNTDIGFDEQQDASSETSPYKTIGRTIQYIGTELRKYPKAHFNIKITITGTEDFNSVEQFHFDNYNINSLNIISTTPDNLFRIVLHGLSGIEKWFISGNIKNLFFKNYKFSVLNNAELDTLYFFKLNNCNIKLENCSFEQDSDKAIDLLRGNNCNFEFDEKLVIKNIKTTIKGNHNTINVKEIEADNVTTLIDGNNNTVKALFDKSKFTNIISTNSQNNVILNKLTNDNKIYGIKNQVSEEITLSNEEEIDYNIGFNPTETIQTDWDSGNDDTGDGTSSNPFKTIEKAVSYLNTLEDSANNGYSLDFGMSDSYVMTEDVRIKIKNAQIYFNTSPGARNIKVKTNKRIIFEGNRNNIEFGGIEFTSDDTNIKSFVDFNNIKGKLFIRNLNFNNNISFTSTGNGYINIRNCANVELNAFEGNNTKSSIFNIYASNCYIHDMVYKNYSGSVEPYGIYDNSVVNISNETYENSSVYGEISNSISTKNISKSLEIINSVASDSETSALSAKQGKVLNDKIESIVNNIPKPTTFKYIYVSTTGNDDTGDGSNSNPYKTIDKVFRVLKSNLDIIYNITFLNGTFDIDNLKDLNYYPNDIGIHGSTNTIFNITTDESGISIKNCKGSINISNIEFKIDSSITDAEINTSFINIDNCSKYVRIEGIKILDIIQDNDLEGSISVNNCNNTLIKNCLFKNTNLPCIEITNSTAFVIDCTFDNIISNYLNVANSVVYKKINHINSKGYEFVKDSFVHNEIKETSPSDPNYYKIYIKQDGLDTNEGTELSPIKTIKRAFELINEKKEYSLDYNHNFELIFGEGDFDCSEGILYGNRIAGLKITGVFDSVNNKIKTIFTPKRFNNEMSFYNCSGSIIIENILLNQGISNFIEGKIFNFYNINGKIIIKNFLINSSGFNSTSGNGIFKFNNCSNVCLDKIKINDGFIKNTITLNHSIATLKNSIFSDIINDGNYPLILAEDSILRVSNNQYLDCDVSENIKSISSIVEDVNRVDHHKIWVNAETGQDNIDDPERGFISSKPFKTIEYAVEHIDTNESGELLIFLMTPNNTSFNLTKTIVLNGVSYKYKKVNIIGNDSTPAKILVNPSVLGNNPTKFVFSVGGDWFVKMVNISVEVGDITNSISEGIIYGILAYYVSKLRLQNCTFKLANPVGAGITNRNFVAIISQYNFTDLENITVINSDTAYVFYGVFGHIKDAKGTGNTNGIINFNSYICCENMDAFSVTGQRIINYIGGTTNGWA